MGIKIIIKNKRAFYDFFIHETYEAGLVLNGTEIKSLRMGKVQIYEAYVSIDSREEAWIYNMNIAHYEFANRHNHEENRKRKLLLHKKEIKEIKGQVHQKDLSVIALKVYLRKSCAKIEIGLAKGKKKFDKRETIKAKAVERQLRQIHGNNLKTKI